MKIDKFLKILPWFFHLIWKELPVLSMCRGCTQLSIIRSTPNFQWPKRSAIALIGGTSDDMQAPKSFPISLWATAFKAFLNASLNSPKSSVSRPRISLCNFIFNVTLTSTLLAGQNLAVNWWAGGKGLWLPAAQHRILRGESGLCTEETMPVPKATVVAGGTDRAAMPRWGPSGSLAEWGRPQPTRLVWE